MSSQTDDPRIGVFVCHCGSNIAGYLKIPDLVEYAKTLPNVVYVQPNLYTCSEGGINEIKKAIQEQSLNRVVVASCTPRTHEPLFRSSCQEAGMNPYLFEMVNIRDQCSWVHMGSPDEGTAKAKDLIRMGVAKATLLVPQTPIESPMEHRALVIGGGIAGMNAASSLAGMGFEVVLVEKSNRLGGMMNYLHRLGPDFQDASEVAAKKIREVEGNPFITVLLESRVTDVNGFIGKYDAAVETPGGTKRIALGVIVVAVGAQVLVPEGLYGYDGERVVTQLQMEALLKAGFDEPKNVVMIQCVGSRNEERKYCSRICCQTAVKNALLVKESQPNSHVTILYRDMQMYGVENETLFRKAKAKGVRFLAYDPADPPKVLQGQVTVYHPLLGKEVVLPADLVVLSTPLVAGPDAEPISKLLRVPMDENKFFLEGHVKLKPLDFATDGIYLCGSARYPANVREAVAQGMGAGLRAAIPLSKVAVTVEPIVSCLTDEDACRGCGLCVSLCPYGALEVRQTEKGRKVHVVSVACKGCGVCAATCYQHALSINSYTDNQLVAQIDAFLGQ